MYKTDKRDKICDEKLETTWYFFNNAKKNQQRRFELLSIGNRSRTEPKDSVDASGGIGAKAPREAAL